MENPPIRKTRFHQRIGRINAKSTRRQNPRRQNLGPKETKSWVYLGGSHYNPNQQGLARGSFSPGIKITKEQVDVYSSFFEVPTWSMGSQDGLVSVVIGSITPILFQPFKRSCKGPGVQSNPILIGDDVSNDHHGPINPKGRMTGEQWRLLTLGLVAVLRGDEISYPLIWGL